MANLRNLFFVSLGLCLILQGIHANKNLVDVFSRPKRDLKEAKLMAYLLEDLDVNSNRLQPRPKRNADAHIFNRPKRQLLRARRSEDELLKPKRLNLE